ncbi:hypothetical protein, partial [Serratia sp. CY43514]|uniref:hypothetical protein n=1 Tax=Serratia sp. CY43514 TaxID=3383620 RepID=UPI0040259B6B
SAKIKWVAYDYGLRIILKNLTLVILRRQVKNYFKSLCHSLRTGAEPAGELGCSTRWGTRGAHPKTG